MTTCRFHASGKEAIGQLYLVLELSGVASRRVRGTIATANDPLDSEPGHRTFRLRLLPRAHRLTLVETQKIFMGLGSPGIIKEKLTLLGLGDATEMRLLGKYPIVAPVADPIRVTGTGQAGPTAMGPTPSRGERHT